MNKNRNNFIYQDKPINKQFINIEGQKFNKLLVKNYVGKIGKLHYWNCLCDCGNEKIIRGSHLKSNRIKSCGCIYKTINITHGESSSDEYNIYCGIIKRCNNPNSIRYKYYGERGIKCLISYEEFKNELGIRPSKYHSVERIDNFKHYELGNLEWSLQKKQCRNTRSNKIMSINQEEKCVAEFAEIYNKNAKIIYNRLSKGWCDNCALFLPKRSLCEHIIKKN